MSKTIPALLATHYAQPTTTLAYCLKVVRLDGGVLGLTSADHSITVSAQVYQPGFGLSDMACASGLDVDNLEVGIFPGQSLLTQAELAAGLWNKAAFTVFECNHLAPGDGINVIKRGTTGDAELGEQMWSIEFRSLKQALQQPLGEVTSKTCRYRLGDSRCTVVLAPFTFACTVTAAASRQVFTDSARTQAAEYFAEGSAAFLTGPNAGYSQKIKSFAAGVFTLSLPMPFAVAIGDTFTAVAGCQKRLTEDCKTKFANVLNFGGEPHLVGADALTSTPGSSS